MKKVESKDKPFLEEQKIHEFMELINNNESKGAVKLWQILFRKTILR